MIVFTTLPEAESTPRRFLRWYSGRARSGKVPRLGEDGQAAPRQRHPVLDLRLHLLGGIVHAFASTSISSHVVPKGKGGQFLMSLDTMTTAA